MERDVPIDMIKEKLKKFWEILSIRKNYSTIIKMIYLLKEILNKESLKLHKEICERQQKIFKDEKIN